MDQITKALQQVASEIQLQKPSERKQIPSLLPIENQILDLKYKSKPFSKMDSSELQARGYALLLKINVITGWIFPEGNEDILVDAFIKKLIISFPNVNPDEMEVAFIAGGSSVKDWGKALNISLIDEVMVPYLERRFEVSKLEEQHKSKQIEAPKENLTDITMQDWLNSLKGKGMVVELMPVMVYDWLEKEGKISASKEVFKTYFKKARGYYKAKLVGMAEKDPIARRQLAEFNRQQQAKLFKGEIADRIRVLIKKIMLYEYVNPENKVMNND